MEAEPVTVESTSTEIDIETISDKEAAVASETIPVDTETELQQLR